VSVSDETNEWVDAAERDRDAVHILVEATRVPYEIVAFHAQQCAEKYLQALLIHQSRHVPFLHDLLKLNRDAQDLCNQLVEVEPECERLTPFGTVTRYPGSAMHPGPGHMPVVTQWMESIRATVRSCLELHQQE
jgi:HEPN domain-containing protein